VAGETVDVSYRQVGGGKERADAAADTDWFE